MDIAFDFVYQVRKFYRKSVPKFRKKSYVKILKLTLFISIVGTIWILRQPLSLDRTQSTPTSFDIRYGTWNFRFYGFTHSTPSKLMDISCQYINFQSKMSTFLYLVMVSYAYQILHNERLRCIIRREILKYSFFLL